MGTSALAAESVCIPAMAFTDACEPCQGVGLAVFMGGLLIHRKPYRRVTMRNGVVASYNSFSNFLLRAGLQEVPYMALFDERMHGMKKISKVLKDETLFILLQWPGDLRGQRCSWGALVIVTCVVTSNSWRWDPCEQGNFLLLKIEAVVYVL